MSGSNTFGGTIKLEGEKAYRQAISQINSDLKVLASEMGKVSAEFSKNDKSATSLTSRNKILNEQIEKQKEKISTLKGALEQSSEKYGENDKKTNNWKVSLNRAEAELIKMEKELGDNEKALKESENATDDNTNSLKKFRGSADEAGKSALKLGDLIKANLISEAIIGGLKALGGAIVDIAKKFADFVKTGIQNASDLVESQNVIDVTFKENAETINDWSKKAANAYGLSELSAKKYNGTIGAMFKSMGLADDEVLTMSTSIVGLSADFASFYNLEHDEAFEKIRSGISGETEPLKQLGINMSVANLEAYALSQGIDKSYKSMTQAEQATLRYNYLMSVSADAQGDFARTSESFANQQKIAQLNLENFATSIGYKLLPICNEALTIFNGMFSGTTNLSEGFSKLTDMIINLATDFINNLPQFAKVGGEVLTQLISGVSSMLTQIAPLATEVINSLISGLTSNISSLASTAVTIVVALATALINALPELTKSAIEIVVALVNGVSDSLPTLIPVIVEAVVLIAQTLIDNIDILLQATINLFMALVKAIPEIIKVLVPKIPEIITSIVNALVENIPILLAGAIELLMALVQAIPEIIVVLVQNIPRIVWAIIEGLVRLPELIWNIMSECIAKFIDWGNQSENAGTEGSQSFLATVINVIKELPQKIWEWLQNVVNKVAEFFGEILNLGNSKSYEFVLSIISKFREIPASVWNALVGAISVVSEWGWQMLSKAKEATRGVFNGIIGILSDLPGQMLTIGGNIVSGIWNGISNSVGWITNKVKAFAGSILGGIKSALGIHSPSKVFEEQVGKNMALGLGEGFTNTMSDVQKQMQNAIPTSFNVEPALSVSYHTNSNKPLERTQNPVQAGITVNIENFVNNRSQDVQAFAQELEFYSRRNAFVTG